MEIEKLARILLDTSLLDVYRFLSRRLRNKPLNVSQNITKGLTYEQQQTLNIMRNDSREIGPPFKPSQQWQGLVDSFEQMFREQGIKKP